MHDLVLFYPHGHEAHYELGHPERPERVETIRQALEAAGWWDHYPQLAPIEISDNLLNRIHDPSYVKILPEISRKGQHLDMDTYTTPASWELALSTAGGAVSTASSVWQGQSRRGFALTRPPGHHATASLGMGFCLLNNVALAAEYLLLECGAQKLAIVDLDLHHGNGTQDIFWRRGDVFYISTHQSPLYPGSGSLTETGAGDGLGCTANFPLPPGSGDQAFMEIMSGIIIPLLDRYQPQIILVSYGFDPHWRDPLGLLQLTATGYGNLIASLASWADDHCSGKIALFLEGGYDLEAAAACSLCVTAALLGQQWQDSLGPSPQTEGYSWQSVYRRARQIWEI